MAERKLRKNEYIPFLDVSGTFNGDGAWTPDWKRIDRSTIFALNPNPHTEETDYISYETPITEISGYKPELPQEIALYKENPIYEYVFELFYDLPVGGSCFIPTLICFAPNGSDSKEEKRAWQVKMTTLTLGEMNTVDGKISFTLSLGGDIQRGQYSVTEGVPTFTEGTFSNGTFSPKQG